MNIAIATIYNETYADDRLFNATACKIGQNLLTPGICLKDALNINGHQYHTVDVYKDHEIDVIIFQDLCQNYIKGISSPIDYIKYIVKRKWKKDYLEFAIKNIPVENRILIMKEPPIVCPASYKKQLHQYFGKIFTWDDKLVDNTKYFKLYYPQVPPNESYEFLFDNKKFLTMICGNKKYDGSKELYSERRKVIDYLEKSDEEFDLYGFGWESESLKNYKGTTTSKLDTLSKYKFAVCYENMCGVHGYITEKIFDCFFAGCVPVYWGADNIKQIIPADTFIDRRNFSDIETMLDFIRSITKEEYEEYIKNIKKYLNSASFKENFSIDSYVKVLSEGILNGRN